MNFSYTIIFLFLVGFFLELSPEKHSDVDRRIALTVEIREPNPCQPDTPRNRQIMDWFLDLPTSDERRIETGTGHLTSSQVELLSDTTAACSYFLNEYATFIAMTIPDTTEQLYDISFYKAGSYYFGIQTLHESTDPNRFAFGLSFILVYDNQFAYIQGYSF